MKKWLVMSAILIMSLIPVSESFAMISNPTNTMVLAKTKKKQSKKKKKTSQTKQSNNNTNKSTTVQDENLENLPVEDVIMDTAKEAPKMNQSEYSDNPALAFLKMFNRILSDYKVIILGIMGLVDLFLIGVLIFRFIKLGSVGGNPTEVKNALTSLGITLLAVAIAGSITLWYGLFYNALR